MNDHIDTAAERAKLAGLSGFTPGPWTNRGPATASVTTFHVHSQRGCRASVYGRKARADADLIAAAPDLLADNHRLLDALEAERARAEKAEAERDEWKDEYQTAARALKLYQEAATNRRAERDQALARLAAAYEAAARLAEDHNDEIFDGFTGDKIGEDAVAQSIRNLTPADAEAALQRVVDAAVRVTIDRIASVKFLRPIVMEQSAGEWTDEMIDQDVATFSNAILALKRPEASHE